MDGPVSRVGRINISMMDSSGTKLSGGKIVSHSDLRGGLPRGVRDAKNSNVPLANGPNHSRSRRASKLLIQFCNIRGLGHTNVNVNAVHQHLENAQPHVLALTETQINPSTNTTYLRFNGYELHTRFRFKGGLCVFARSDVACQREDAMEDDAFDIAWFKINMFGRIIFLCCLYRSPNDNQPLRLFQYLGDKVDWIEAQHPTAEIILLGDFNAHNSNWLRHSNKTDEAGRQAETFAISRNLAQLIDEPTRIPDHPTDSSNTLDLFLTSVPDGFGVEVLAPLGNSDHNLVSATGHNVQSLQQDPKPPRRIWHYNRADWNEMRDFFSCFPFNDVCFSDPDINTCTESLTEVIHAGMDLYIPHSMKRSSAQQPWFNKECEKATAAKNKAYKVWRRNPTEETRATFTRLRNMSNLTTETAKTKFNEGVKNKLLEQVGGTRQFWTMAKTVSNNFCKSSFPPLVRADGSLASTPKEKADLFAQMFSNNSVLDPQNAVPPTIPPVESSMAEIKFRVRAVRRALEQLDCKKAVGLDGIPPIVLKKCAPELAPILTRLFQYSYQSQTFPNTWKMARIQPIPKRGKKCMPQNYRPVSLLSIISKVMERVINDELIKYLESQRIISDRQYGFRRQRSTGDLLAYVTHIWTSAMEKHGESKAIALDISKAFDRVWHAALMNKLIAYGLPEKLRGWMGSFLASRVIQVVVDGITSDRVHVNAGVPQGSILSPTLFLLHINDLLSSTDNKIFGFADDCTLVASFNSQRPLSAEESKRQRSQQIDSLNSDLQNIMEWGRLNLVDFNAGKTQATTFSRKVSSREPPLLMQGHQISPKNAMHLLGITVTSSICWHEHVSAIAKSASAKLSFLFRAKRYFTPSQLLLLYKTQIRPGLEYCSHVWGSAPKHSLNLLDSIQKRAVRLIDHPEITRDLQPLALRRQVADLSLFYRYLHGRCSEDLRDIIPGKLSFRRNTRLAKSSHTMAIELATPRTSLFKNSFVYRTGELWNSLPSTIFPTSYNLSLFKKRVNKHLTSSQAPTRAV